MSTNRRTIFAWNVVIGKSLIQMYVCLPKRSTFVFSVNRKLSRRSCRFDQQWYWAKNSLHFFLIVKSFDFNWDKWGLQCFNFFSFFFFFLTRKCYTSQDLKSLTLRKSHSSFLLQHLCIIVVWHHIKSSEQKICRKEATRTYFCRMNNIFLSLDILLE